jgi:Tn7-like transposition protein D
MRLVGHTAESFFASLSTRPRATVRKPKSFGRGPCLTPVCADYRKSKIRKVKIRESWKLDGVPVITVPCRCGFTYARRGPDPSPEDRFRFDHINAYGPTWEAALADWWEDMSLSIHQMAPRLGVAHNTVKYQAIRLGLNFPRAGPGPKVAKVNSIIQEAARRKQERQSSEVDADLIKAKREEWLEAIKQNPSAIRTRLQRDFPLLFSWLLKYDNGWLKENIPPLFKRTGSAREIADWSGRDFGLEKEVREAAERLKRVAGRPVRITITAIARELDRKELLQKEKHLAKLPITQQALDEVAETRAQFALRRLRWAAGCFRNEGLVPAKSALALRAGVDYGIWKDEEMGAALDTEWSSLQELPDPSRLPS